MSSVGKLGVVLLLLRPRSLGLGGVELGEVSFVAVRRKKESKIEVSSIRREEWSVRMEEEGDELIETFRVLPDDIGCDGVEERSIVRTV